jgi:protein-S-isoprenylcysteine O-methyltransferase Ste14
MIPVILCFFYGILSSVFNLPFPAILKKSYWNNDIYIVCAIVVCTFSIVWFGITLKTFGESFRIGIDKNTNNKLITTGTFSVTRNPIYAAFILFFIGILTAYANVITLIFLILLIAAIHRQIVREEIFLNSHYGNEYKDYCKRVRRYL